MMDGSAVVRENFLTKKPRHNGWTMMFVLAALFYTTNIIYFNEWADWLPATASAVFKRHHYWQAWTALFAHGDMGHFMSNMFLFLPLTYLLTGYYGYWFFPFVGFLMGGLTNLLVLATLPLETRLLGISGVVYWMGAAWLTLFVIIDRRSSLRKRCAVAISLAVILFIPETYKPEISHLSHFVGFMFGVAAAVAYYFIHRARIEREEVIEYMIEEPAPEQFPM